MNLKTAAWTRRTLLRATAGSLLAKPVKAEERLGLNIPLDPEEAGARKQLHAARQAGFRRLQVYFDWTKVSDSYLQNLPQWIKAEDLKADVLGAYVNCVAPDILIMNTRAKDLDRAIEVAPTLGATCITAWTGGYGPKLFTSDPKNFTPEASDAILRTLEPRFKKLEAAQLLLALESYITLACPDAQSLRGLLNRTPNCIGAVFDPPNLTPINAYEHRDDVLSTMAETLRGRVGVVHWKDFRLAKDGHSYDLPGPLGGVMNYSLFLECVKQFPQNTPIVVEHVTPDQYATVHAKIAPIFVRAFKT
jgi:sugar phosphate isomerase/epimerase